MRYSKLPSDPKDSNGTTLSGIALKIGAKVAIMNNNPTAMAVFLFGFIFLIPFDKFCFAISVKHLTNHNILIIKIFAYDLNRLKE